MKIGVGVSTFRRPAHFKLWLEQYDKYKTDDMVLHSAVGIRGVAAAKNDCLRALKDCDYIILFDDDCYPIVKGWEMPFISSNYEHLLYLNKTHNPFIHCGNGATIYCDAGGVFMYMTKRCVDGVGAFDEKFGLYGFEHCNYSRRIALYLGEQYNFISLDRTSEYLYAADYDTAIKNESSISDLEKRVSIAENWNKYFKEPIKSVYLPL